MNRKMKLLIMDVDDWKDLKSDLGDGSVATKSLMYRTDNGFTIQVIPHGVGSDMEVVVVPDTAMRNPSRQFETSELLAIIMTGGASDLERQLARTLLKERDPAILQG